MTSCGFGSPFALLVGDVQSATLSDSLVRAVPTLILPAALFRLLMAFREPDRRAITHSRNRPPGLAGRTRLLSHRLTTRREAPGPLAAHDPLGRLQSCQH